MAKLLTIENEKLWLHNIKNTNDMLVISIIGDARKGKSSFLSVFACYLSESDINIFKISSSIEHCTCGIDYVIIEKNNKKYLLLDCQGLNYENSSNDSKLLLFIYTISNIIIYNDKNILNNNVFTTLQPMALFLNNFIEKNTNVILYFRIADYEMDENPSVLLEKIFNLQNDQYDNVRTSLTKLFSDIKINTTEPLLKVHKYKLNNNPKNFLLETDNFTKVIDDILYTINLSKPKNINLEHLINNINNNQSIDYKKLDIYTLNTKIEILDFIKKLDNDDNFMLFNTDGYDNTRIKIDTYYENISQNEKIFNSLFTSVPNELKNEYYNKIFILHENYVNMKYKNEKIASSIIEPEYNKLINNINEIINEYLQNNENYNSVDIIYYYSTFIKNLYKNININVKHFRNKYLKKIYYFNKINDNKYLIDKISKLNYVLYDKNTIDEYRNKLMSHMEKIKHKILDIILYNYKIINKVNNLIENIQIDDYIKNITITCMSIDKLCNGNYKKFKKLNEPYKNINLDKFICSIEGNKDDINNEILNIKKKLYKKKYMDNDNHKNLYYNQIKKIINKTYLYKNIPLDMDDYKNYLIPNDIVFVKLHLSLLGINNECCYIELNNFYNMLDILNIPIKVYKYYYELYKNIIMEQTFINFSCIDTINILYNPKINECIIGIIYDDYKIDKNICILEKINNYFSNCDSNDK
jgi:hypothetical protein